MPSVAGNSGTGSGETPNPLVLMSWMISAVRPPARDMVAPVRRPQMKA
jgi:hypothetical protein